MEFTSTCIKNEMFTEISQCCSITLLIDELTDITLKKVLTMNIGYFVEGTPKTRFLGIIELKKGDASTVYEGVENCC